MRRRIPGLAAWIVAGVGLGLLAGAAVALSATGRPHRLGRTVADTPPPAVTHVAPLLRAPGEPAELRYDVYCLSAPEGSEEAPCDASGTAYVRASAGASFRAVAMQVDSAATTGKYVARIPADLAAAPGFQYYAVFRDNANGKTTTLPTGGA